MRPLLAVLLALALSACATAQKLGAANDVHALLVSIRDDFYKRGHLLRNYVVHGHTPVTRATRYGARINIDTGAYYSGRLTALRIWRGRGRYLTT